MAISTPVLRSIAGIGFSCLALWGTGARADEADVFNFIVGQTVTYDDNLFRLSDSADTRAILGTSQRSDTVSTTYGGLTFDKLVSRQKLHADVIWNMNRFSRFSELDYNGMRAKALWDWQFGNYLKGTLGYDRNRKLIDFGNLTPGDRGRVRDINTFERIYGSADWWFHPNYSVGAGYSHVSSSYSSELRRASEYDADAVELNGKFQPKTGNQIGLSLRRTNGRYPNRELAVDPVTGAVVATVDNSFEQTDSEVNGDWRLTGQSRVFGRLGYTTRKHDQLGQRDFSGVTARLNYNWAFEGKTEVNVILRREIGAVEDIDASYVLTEGVTLNPIWHATAKITLSARYDWAKRRYEGDPFEVLGGASTLSLRKDTVNSVGATALYRPLRSLEIGLTLRHERRTSSRALADYDATLGSLSARFSF